MPRHPPGCARLLRAAAEPFSGHRVLVHLAFGCGQLDGEGSSQGGQRHLLAPREEAGENRVLVGHDFGRIPIARLGQHPILLAGNLGDRQEAADRQVDDGRGQVLRVGALVEDESQLRRTKVLRGLELNHHRLIAEERRRVFLRIVREVVLGQVGAVASVGQPVPDHEADPGHEHEQGYPDRQRVDVERVLRERSQARLEHRRRNGHRALFQRRHDRHLLARPQLPGR